MLQHAEQAKTNVSKDILCHCKYGHEAECAEIYVGNEVRVL